MEVENKLQTLKNLGQDWADHAVTNFVGTWLWTSGRMCFISDIHQSKNEQKNIEFLGI